ncbi:hypothetical protein OBBRIDRAFT_890100 [Obba rivulosa]|uniref:Zn(2)-C6 fungal-type domain-containing protein n=1 Tax=Obba rivulosa TaxID=1052685 RepID=A0A8E2ARF4_9APHY|nr:hypothetical protein OBBRIDRAFT_890100 [Obba rivulosa]
MLTRATSESLPRPWQPLRAGQQMLDPLDLDSRGWQVTPKPLQESIVYEVFITQQPSHSAETGEYTSTSLTPFINVPWERRGEHFQVASPELLPVVPDQELLEIFAEQREVLETDPFGWKQLAMEMAVAAMDDTATMGLQSDAPLAGPSSREVIDTAAGSAGTRIVPKIDKYGTSCLRCRKGKMRCEKAAEGGPCIGCRKAAASALRRSKEKVVCDFAWEVSHRGRPKGVRNGQGKNQKQKQKRDKGKRRA